MKERIINWETFDEMVSCTECPIIKECLYGKDPQAYRSAGICKVWRRMKVAVTEKENEMKNLVYIVMWQDRHTDTESYLFHELEDAIVFAKKTATEECRNPEDLRIIETVGWEFHIEYTCEGDCLWIVRSTIS